MRKFESSQKEESRAQSAGSSNAMFLKVGGIDGQRAKNQRGR